MNKRTRTNNYKVAFQNHTLDVSECYNL